MFRAGGETWIAGSYDPDLNLTYWGVAQAKPWMPASRGTTVFDEALYTASTLALNVDTGKLAWHFQHAPGESLDLDEVFERVLVDIGAQKFVFTAGKAGILWKLDRTNGKFIGYKETVFQNVFDRIDPKTGVPTYRADIVEQKIEQWIAVVPEHRGRPQLAGDELPPADRRAHHPAEPVLHGDVGTAGRAEGRHRRDQRGSPLLRDAGRTATSASSPRSTSRR